MRTLLLGTLLVLAAVGVGVPTVAADHICRPLEPPWECSHSQITPRYLFESVCAKIEPWCGNVEIHGIGGIKVLLP